MSNIQKINTEISDFINYINNGGEIKPVIEDIHLITLDVAGLYYIDNIDEIFPKLKKGMHLNLFRERDNEYDEYAIKIKFEGNKIGYVPKKHNIILASLLDSGKELYGVIDQAYEDSIYEGYDFKVLICKIFLKE